MKGRKEVLWAVVISAALITAGLILSCGDDGDDNGGVEFSCQDVCEKFDECGWIEEEGDFGETVEDCKNGCEENFDPADEGVEDLFECIVDTDCNDIFGDCWCQIACEKLDDCGLLGVTVDDCVDDCEENKDIDFVLCILETDCDEIVINCIET